MVLLALTEKTYEPLCLSPPILLAFLMLHLLIATASTHRARELHALCIDPLFLIEDPLSFLLAPDPLLLAGIEENT